MIKAITFDLDGVYFVKGKSNFIQSLQNLGVTEENAISVFLKSDRMNTEYKCGKISDTEYWEWALSEWKLNLSVQEIVNLLIGGYEVNKDVRETVRKAKRHGYKTLICSNNFPARIQGLHNRFGFLTDFDVSVFSYEVGTTKPDSTIFQELIRKSGVNSYEIVFADDNEENLSGARSLGINTFFYENFGQFVTELQSLGVDLK